MKENKIFTWTTETGNEVEYILGCEYRNAYNELIDGGWGGKISHKAEIIFTCKVSVNGSQLFEKTFEGDVLRDAMAGYATTATTDKAVISVGERYYVAGHGEDDQLCIIPMPEDIYNSISGAMDEFENSFEDIVAMNKEELETEKARLVKFIEKAEKQDWLPTNAEYAEWRKAYNNVMNEGGAGYIPPVITKEALENAKLRLEEFKR